MSKAKTHKQSAAKKQLDMYIEFHMAIDSLLMYDAEVADGWDGPDARTNTLEALKALIQAPRIKKEKDIVVEKREYNEWAADEMGI